MHGHLISVKVGVESGTHQGMNFDGLSFNQHRLEGLYAESMQGWRTIQQHGVLFNNVFQNIPDYRLVTLHHLLSPFDGGGMPFFLQTVVNKGLEQLKRHNLGKTALVKFQLRTDYND